MLNALDIILRSPLTVIFLNTLPVIKHLTLSLSNGHWLGLPQLAQLIWKYLEESGVSLFAKLSIKREYILLFIFLVDFFILVSSKESKVTGFKNYLQVCRILIPNISVLEVIQNISSSLRVDFQYLKITERIMCMTINEELILFLYKVAMCLYNLMKLHMHLCVEHTSVNICVSGSVYFLGTDSPNTRSSLKIL